MAYRIYVTDTIQLLGDGKVRRDRFYDKIFGKKPDNRSAEEIAHDILSRAGVEVIKNGSI